MLRILTAGESHGKALVSIIEGFPSGVKILIEDIDRELARRQVGYGRGNRMKIEKDQVEIISGLRKNITLGSPITLLIQNRDFRLDDISNLTRPRPGHADLAGAIKYNQHDIRNILERASARETAIRVAVGALGKILLKEFNIEIISQVISIGGIKAKISNLLFHKIKILTSKSILRCPDSKATRLMIKEIDQARRKGDTVGGIFEILVNGLCPGLGSYVHYDRRLDANLARALMSIPAVKAVEIGNGVESVFKIGSKVHDAIYYKKGIGFYRKTNNAGGLEGGVTNGEILVLKGYMKPIATLSTPLPSVDIISKKPYQANLERHDYCAVPAAGVVGEAVVAIELVKALSEKFGGDSLKEMLSNYHHYLKQVKEF
jgi:chorismate synthase